MLTSSLTLNSKLAGRGRRRLFTLLELSVVLLLLGLALAIVLPRVGVVPLSIQVSDTTNRLNNAFFTAASLAVASGTPVLLTCDFAQGELRLAHDGAAGADPYASNSHLAEAAVEIGEGPRGGPSPLLNLLSTVKLPEGVTPDNELLASDEAPVFVFFANGEAAGPKLRFRVASRLFSLTVDPLTGRPLYDEAATP